MRNLTKRPLSALDPADGNDVSWLMMIPLFAALDTLFEGGTLGEVGLVLLSASVLAGIIGVRRWTLHRAPLQHEQSHLTVAILTGVVIWTVLVIGGGIVGVVGGLTNAEFVGSVALLLTVGQLLPVLIGAIWGLAMRDIDWYPLRRTRASVIRASSLYGLMLLMLGITSALMIDLARWQWLLALSGQLLIWLGIARLWRG